MSSARALTGGTFDVNPQYISFTATESGVDTFTEEEINIPVMRIAQSRNRAQVIELLKLFVHRGGGTGNGDALDWHLSTESRTTMGNMGDSEIILQDNDFYSLVTNGAVLQRGTIVYDFTDNAGHGLIIATPKLYFGIEGSSQTAAQTITGKILYRFKNVSLQEFIGLAIEQSS